MNNADTVAWGMALRYVNNKFNLLYGNADFESMSSSQLKAAQGMMEDWVDPDDRDSFFDCIETFRLAYIAGYTCGFQYAEDLLRGDIR